MVLQKHTELTSDLVIGLDANTLLYYFTSSDGAHLNNKQLRTKTLQPLTERHLTEGGEEGRFCPLDPVIVMRKEGQ